MTANAVILIVGRCPVGACDQGQRGDLGEEVHKNPGAIGADGYGQLYLTRERSGLCVRPHRYALAIVSGVVAAGGLGLHECDNRCASRSRRQQNPISTSVRPAG